MSGRLEVWECPNCLTRFSIVEPAFEGAEDPLCPHCVGEDCEHVGPLSEWRPIHTAPRLSEAVLVVADGSVVVAAGGTGTFRTRPGGWTIHPTLWMPIPDLPKAQEESDAV